MTEKIQLKNFGQRAERTLSIRPATLAREFESAMDGQTLAEVWFKRGMTSLTVVLWSALKHEDDRLTIARVVSYVDDYVGEGGDLEELREAASKALILSGVFGKDMQEKAVAGKVVAPASA